MAKRFFEVYELIDSEIREGRAEDIFILETEEEIREVESILPENYVLREITSTGGRINGNSSLLESSS
nr:hypothetical protein [Neobacillus sp. Marseille-Q6967]